MAEGKHPVTFRTRKLSLPAPMVLHRGRCGRVGRRRTIFYRKGSPHAGWPLFLFPRETIQPPRNPAPAAPGCRPDGFAVASLVSGLCGFILFPWLSIAG